MVALVMSHFADREQVCGDSASKAASAEPALNRGERGGGSIGVVAALLQEALEVAG